MSPHGRCTLLIACTWSWTTSSVKSPPIILSSLALALPVRRPPPCSGTSVPQLVLEGPFLAAGTIGLLQSGSRWSRLSLEWGKCPSLARIPCRGHWVGSSPWGVLLLRALRWYGGLLCFSSGKSLSTRDSALGASGSLQALPETHRVTRDVKSWALSDSQVISRKPRDLWQPTYRSRTAGQGAGRAQPHLAKGSGRFLQ